MPVAVAVAVRSTRSPAAAWLPTLTLASSSSDCNAVRAPTLHDVPLPSGHTVKPGAYTWSSLLVCTRTVTESLTLLALQTQITKLAVCAGRTWAELVNG